jgi:hypothetical protein
VGRVARESSGRARPGWLIEHSVIYVGQTENLQDRFANHHKWDCMIRNSANCVCAHQVPDEARRLAIGNDLIVAYKPPCNG